MPNKKEEQIRETFKQFKSMSNLYKLGRNTSVLSQFEKKWCYLLRDLVVDRQAALSMIGELETTEHIKLCGNILRVANAILPRNLELTVDKNYVQFLGCLIVTVTDQAPMHYPDAVVNVISYLVDRRNGADELFDTFQDIAKPIDFVSVFLTQAHAYFARSQNLSPSFFSCLPRNIKYSVQQSNEILHLLRYVGDVDTLLGSLDELSNLDLIWTGQLNHALSRIEAPRDAQSALHYILKNEQRIDPANIALLQKLLMLTVQERRIDYQLVQKTFTVLHSFGKSPDALLRDAEFAAALFSDGSVYRVADVSHILKRLGVTYQSLSSDQQEWLFARTRDWLLRAKKAPYSMFAKDLIAFFGTGVVWSDKIYHYQEMILGAIAAQSLGSEERQLIHLHLYLSGAPPHVLSELGISTNIPNVFVQPVYPSDSYSFRLLQALYIFPNEVKSHGFDEKVKSLVSEIPKGHIKLKLTVLQQMMKLEFERDVMKVLYDSLIAEWHTMDDDYDLWSKCHDTLKDPSFSDWYYTGSHSERIGLVSIAKDALAPNAFSKLLDAGLDCDILKACFDSKAPIVNKAVEQKWMWKLAAVIVQVTKQVGLSKDVTQRDFERVFERILGKVYAAIRSKYGVDYSDAISTLFALLEVASYEVLQTPLKKVCEELCRNPKFFTPMQIWQLKLICFSMPASMSPVMTKYATARAEEVLGQKVRDLVQHPLVELLPPHLKTACSEMVTVSGIIKARVYVHKDRVEPNISKSYLFVLDRDWYELPTPAKDRLKSGKNVCLLTQEQWSGRKELLDCVVSQVKLTPDRGVKHHLPSEALQSDKRLHLEPSQGKSATTSDESVKGITFYPFNTAAGKR